MTRAAIYARYSSDLQRETSIDDQVRLAREFAMREGWNVVECYTDHAISGSNLRRPGMQMMMQDAAAGHFEVIVAESLDRLSRDQEDIAHIHKRLSFAGISIHTLSEGAINELHIGLKGTMGALYLKDLADKTRRGLRGRVEAGKSGGGNAYGYDVVHTAAGDGAVQRGDRQINAAEAAVINRIFTQYAKGMSPRAIAHALNSEGIPGPSGKGWGPSTIHGNRQRGTGILNNELYVGRLVWNRLRYVKDPATGKRISRLNPESAWIIQDVPELRIVDQALWDEVKARQGELQANRDAHPDKWAYWDRRRPRFLFTGLMRCGVCGGGVVNFNNVRIGCATARNKGTCSNKTTMLRSDLEAMVLDGLQHHLMDPALVDVFCQTYTAHMNKLAAEHNAGRTGKQAELDKVTRDLGRLIQAIIDGVPGAQVKDKIAALEQRKATLTHQLAHSEPAPVSLHPNMAAYYREAVADLREALLAPDKRDEAAAVVRDLIDAIVLTPVDGEGEVEGKKTLSVQLVGRLAGILSLATGASEPLSEDAPPVRVAKLVAGARSRVCYILKPRRALSLCNQVQNPHQLAA